MRKSFKTPKGTELTLLDMRGKEYLEVKFRLVWFREDHPDWSIDTELVKLEQDSALFKTTIRDESGRAIASAHKYEDRKGFPDFIEKAETGSSGRALAMVGYGTQFCADELDEGERIVDGPVQPKGNLSESGKYVIKAGSLEGRALEDIMPEDLSVFYKKLLDSKDKTPIMIETIAAIEEFRIAKGKK